MGRKLLTGLALACGLITACDRQPSAPSANAGTSNPGDPAAPPSPRGLTLGSDSNATPAVINDTGDVNATLQKLTAELRDYVVRTHSVPKDFSEFAAKSQIRFPAAPAGKKYAIENQQVVLEKR